MQPPHRSKMLEEIEGGVRLMAVDAKRDSRISIEKPIHPRELGPREGHPKLERPAARIQWLELVGRQRRSELAKKGILVQKVRGRLTNRA